jgi:hypothetical protein
MDQRGIKLNNTGEILGSIETAGMFTDPAESYLMFEGRLTKADGAVYANDDVIAVVHNGLMYLLSCI